MLRRQAFVSPLVVAGDPGHELLRFTDGRTVEVDEEGLRSLASNRCGDATVMKDLHVAALSDASSKTQIVILFAGHSFADVHVLWVARANELADRRYQRVAKLSRKTRSG